MCCQFQTAVFSTRETDSGGLLFVSRVLASVSDSRHNVLFVAEGVIFCGTRASHFFVMFICSFCPHRTLCSSLLMPSLCMKHSASTVSSLLDKNAAQGSFFFFSYIRYADSSHFFLHVVLCSSLSLVLLVPVLPSV